ncbi:MAG: tetratricopeptide repeat protein [Gallionella sp.]
MSLLLDARKKSQEASSAQDAGNAASGSGLSLEDLPNEDLPSTQPSDTNQEVDHARNAGQNLFDAKIRAPHVARASINRNLLIALGATLVLLAGGGGYVWYEISGVSQPVRQYAAPSKAITQPVQIATAPPPAAARIETSAEKVDAPLVPTKIALAARKPAKKATARPARKKTPAFRIKRHKKAKESINTVLNNAYQAYLVGDLDKAKPMYQKALKMNARNTDALLGLAAISQRSGSDNIAAYYYAQVLELDPRDPVANAGMSGLTTSDNTESRLKKLLYEQQDSSALHFALGNQYAAQARWADAQQSYFNAYKLDPEKAQLAFNLGVSLDKLGQQKLAAQYYLRALELDPQKNAGFDHAQISSRIEELTH